MFSLAWLFLPDQPAFRTGLILIGIAPCIAMVLIWIDLAQGNREAAALKVAMIAILSMLDSALPGNTVELAIAVCISLWGGATSQQTLADGIGPLIEVSVFVALVVVPLWLKTRLFGGRSLTRGVEASTFGPIGVGIGHRSPPEPHHGLPLHPPRGRRSFRPMVAGRSWVWPRPQTHGAAR